MFDGLTSMYADPFRYARAVEAYEADGSVPHELRCSISGEALRRAVTVGRAGKQCYEERLLALWVARCGTDPVTRARIDVSALQRQRQATALANGLRRASGRRHRERGALAQAMALRWSARVAWRQACRPPRPPPAAPELRAASTLRRPRPAFRMTDHVLREVGPLHLPWVCPVDSERRGAPGLDHLLASAGHSATLLLLRGAPALVTGGPLRAAMPSAARMLLHFGATCALMGVGAGSLGASLSSDRIAAEAAMAALRLGMTLGCAWCPELGESLSAAVLLHAGSCLLIRVLERVGIR